MMEVYGIDVGYGFVKAAAPDGRRCIFPSAACRAVGSGDLASVLGGQGLRHRVAVQRLPAGTQEEWLVGDAALAAGASRTWDSEASQRDGYDVLTMASVSILGAEGAVILSLGLPLGLWLKRQERQALRDRLSGLAARVSVDGGPTRSILVTKVKVFPQSVGAYVAALHRPGGERLAGKAVGVVDVGFKTCDYLLLVPGPDGVAVPDEARCGSVDAGIGQATEAVRQYLAGQVGTLPPEGVVEAALRGGGLLPVRGRDLDLRPIYQEALADLAARVEAEIRRVWTAQLDYLAAVLLAGGGGAALAPYLRLPCVQVVPEAIHANALGFALLAGQG